MSDPLVVPVDGKTLDWPRRVANAFKAAAAQISGQAASITALQADALTRRQYPFEALASAPATPAEGRTYYDTATHKVMTWDGTAWQPHY